MENYKLVRCDSHSRHTTGVAVYQQKNVDFHILHNECYLKNVWCLVFEVKKGELNGVYCILYRSPSSSVTTSFTIYYDLLKNYVSPTKKCLWGL